MIVPTVKNIQEQLLCYDFSLIPEEDIFGELLAQLSQREHRLLLGQDFTPHWVAKNMAEQVLSEIDETPKMLEMCIRDSLGHKGVRSVQYYRKMSNQRMADETREVRNFMSQIILASLDGWGEEYEQIRQDAGIE